MLVLEAAVYEKQINQAKQKYMLQINKNTMLKEKVVKKQQQIKQEEDEFGHETVELEAYEQHFKSKLQSFEQELDEV